MPRDSNGEVPVGEAGDINGIAALREHFAALRAELLPHPYEVVDPEVRILGDFAVLTFRYEPRSSAGKPFTPLPRWEASSVYQLSAGEWRSVHAHWSVVKESTIPPSAFSYAV
jgi:uncharacterized protein DUF4440